MDVTMSSLKTKLLKALATANLHALESTIFITEDKRVDLVWIHYFISS